MGWRFSDSFSINWDYGAADARLYEFVSGGANVRVRSGRLEIKDAGGRIRRASCGGDYAYTDMVVRCRWMQIANGQVLTLYARDSGAGHVKVQIDSASGGYSVSDQTDAPAGSGSITVNAGDGFAIECSGGATATIRLRRSAAGGGAWQTVATLTAPAPLSGQGGLEVAGQAGDLAKIADYYQGPLVDPPRHVFKPRSRVYAMVSTLDINEGDAQARVPDLLWNSGWEAWLQAAVDPLIARGYDHLWVRGPGGNNTDGVEIGVDGVGVPFRCNMHFLRLNDILRDTGRSGFTTVAADGRLADGFMTAWASRRRHFADVAMYGCYPPSGGNGTAWPTTDAGLEEWHHEIRDLGFSLQFDGSAGIAPAHVDNVVARAYLNYLLRTRLPGERFGFESHGSYDAARAPYFEPPYLAQGVAVGPLFNDALSYHDLSGTSIFYKATESEPQNWYGPSRLTSLRHFATLDGSISPTNRKNEGLRVLRRDRRVGLIIETAGLSAADDAELQWEGRIPGAAPSHDRAAERRR